VLGVVGVAQNNNSNSGKNKNNNGKNKNNKGFKTAKMWKAPPVVPETMVMTVMAEATR
jgi:hypothetical protein